MGKRINRKGHERGRDLIEKGLNGVDRGREEESAGRVD